MVYVKMTTLLRLEKNVVEVKVTTSLKIGDLHCHGYNNHRIKVRRESYIMFFQKLSRLVVVNVMGNLLPVAKFQSWVIPATQPTTSKWGNLSIYIYVIRTALLLGVIITTAARWNLSLKHNYRLFMGNSHYNLFCHFSW